MDQKTRDTRRKRQRRNRTVPTLLSVKRPFKAREVAFILLPVLGLGAFAWYQKRVEDVNQRGMFVSSIELMPETRGYYQHTGNTHKITVTIDHPWPRPSWWGRDSINNVSVDALQSDTQLRALRYGTKPDKSLLAGGALTTSSSKHKDFTVKGASNWAASGGFVEGHYVFTHEIPLAKVPAKEGAVTFHALYGIAGQKPIRVTRVLRKKGQTISFKPNRDPKGRIVSIKPESFHSTTAFPGNIKTDEITINFLLTRTVSGSQKPKVMITDLQLHDARSQIFKSYSTPGFHNSWGAGPDENSDVNVKESSISLNLAPTLKTTNPLVLEGVISVDDGWPILFSVRLPKR